MVRRATKEPFSVFDLGEVVYHPSTIERFGAAFVFECLSKHGVGCWGQVTTQEQVLNDVNLDRFRMGELQTPRFESAYVSENGRLRICTETGLHGRFTIIDHEPQN